MPIVVNKLKKCKWIYSPDDYQWHTECSHESPDEGKKPSELGWEWCPFCGWELVEDADDFNDGLR